MREYCEVLLLLSCFLAYNSEFSVGDELRCIEKEREALLQFKKGLADENGFLSSWGSEEHKKECCQWQGIKCSHDSGHVISLQLSTCEDFFMRFRGENISSALFELNYLTHLDLSCHYFAKFPDFIGNLTNLRTLNLESCDILFDNLNWLSRLSSLSLLNLSDNRLKDASVEFFGGVHPLGNLTNLRTLNLRSCDLVFDNLNWLSGLSSLSLLDLSHNRLKDANSLQDIFNLPFLKELYLIGCDLFSMHFSINSSSTSLSILDLSSTRLNYDLQSNIPSDLGRFTFLEYLDLSRNGLIGGIPKSFGNLSHLRTLDLSHNQLTGGIPKSFQNLSHLQMLNLSRNRLSESLPELFYKLSVGAKQSLEILELQENNFYGSVPDVTLLPSMSILRLQRNQLNGYFLHSFAHISNLDVLDLSNNQIWGSVPDLGAFVSLRELHLGGNKLTSLPSSLGQLSMLEILDLSFNSLKGTISEIHLSNLNNLKQLDLSVNQLAFNFSVDWIPPFQLNVIKLASAYMGPRFPTWLHTQTNLSELDLSCTSITEEVPKWFWDLSHEIVYLNLSHNQIIGSIPDLSPLNYRILDISFNNFSGLLPLPPHGSLVFSLSNNMFAGSISSICTATYDFDILDLSDNQFSGELPNCWENNTSLNILNLSNNKFSGNIPHSLGSLGGLRILQLHNNNFSGELPSTLMDCSMLKMFDVGANNLGGKIPVWIGTHLQNLKILSLGHNNFFGNIPTEICYLTGIQIFDLSRNFLSGKLPQCFNNFTSLIQQNFIFNSFVFGQFYDLPGHSTIHVAAYIDHVFVQWKRQQAEYRKTTVGLVKLVDLSSNRLVGNIPNELSQLRALVSLNLSRNYLSGNIIPNIGQMELLETLDLSRNNFFGEIPKGLAKLDRLAVLDLSNNYLSGKIPSSTQLQSFEPSVYASNDGLCGPPLTRCPGDHEPNPPTTQHGKQEINVDDDFMAQLHSHEFYIPIIMGFIVGFWGIVAMLVLKNSWRYAYFDFFSRMGDWLYVTTMVYAGRLKRKLRNNVPN